MEELDRAIALSLAGGLKKPNGYGWRPNNNEDLAKAVQDDLHSSYPPCVSKEYQPVGYRVCNRCNRDIGYGNYLGCMGTFFTLNVSIVVATQLQNRTGGSYISYLVNLVFGSQMLDAYLLIFSFPVDSSSLYQGLE